MQAVINGIIMGYDDVGSGIPLVLIHGFPLCRKMWHPQLRKLPAAGIRVVAPDLRGFGDSDVLDGPYSMELFADDIIQLLDHLEIERAVIGGMSMGGYVLFNLIERYPHRLQGACFITTRATADDEVGKARRLHLAQEVMKQGPQIIAEAFETLLFAQESLTDRPKLVATVREWMTSTASRGLAGGLLAMRERKDYRPFLQDISLPSLAIGGVEDRAAPPETARVIAEGIPGCRLCMIPDAGHMANLEHPKEFNRCLVEFLQTL